jgi:MgtC family protein
MLQVNLLLPVSGKTAQSFAVLDLMRLPLEILSGMGFIGAGAIVRKGNLVRGLTTAATIWLGTVRDCVSEAGYEIGPWAISYLKLVSQRELSYGGAHMDV